MIVRSGPRYAAVAAAGCLLLAGCGPAKPAASGAAPTPAATDTNAATANAANNTAASAPAAAATAAAPAAGTAAVACDLITEAQASTAIGEAAGPGRAGGGPALSECIFDDGALIISMKKPGKDLYQQSRAKLPAGRFTDVPGVGDGAFETGGGQAPLTTMEFYKGTTLVSILFTGTKQSPKDAIITIAKIAADRI